MRIDQLIQGNDSLQDYVNGGRKKEALYTVAPMARESVYQEILPQIEASISNLEDAEVLCESVKKEITEAFSSKNDVYIRLTSYKGIEQSDQQFLEDCLIVMDEWLRATQETLGETKQENHKVDVSVEVNPGKSFKKDILDAVSESITLALEDELDFKDFRL